MGILAAKLLNSDIPPKKVDFDQLTSKILSLVAPEKIIIFGSAKDALLSPLSDIDIAVLFADKASLLEGKKKILNSKIFNDIETDFLFYTIDQFNKKSQIGGVCFEIFHTGNVIYDKKSDF